MAKLLLEKEGGNRNLKIALKVEPLRMKVNESEMKAFIVLGKDNETIVVVSDLVCVVESPN